MKNHTSIEDLEQFFGEPASEIIPDEAACVFVLNKAGLQLKVIINEVAPSFATTLRVENSDEMRMEFDGLEELSILGDKIGPYLLARFSVTNSAQCIVRLVPSISVCWSVLN